MPWFTALAITLALAELALRVTGITSHEILRASPPKSTFWKHDESLGWSLKPNTSGAFSNGYFNGFVTIDERGIRKNSRTGTYIDGYDNILFIGDSATASFEVDDGETVPALLEQALRDRGYKYNVINLGVRAYSTDQEVRAAIRFSDLYPPTDIIYMFVDNDIPGNNMMKRADKEFGKGIYITREEDESFEPYNYPVPRYPTDYGAVVLFDRACNPLVYEYSSRENQTTRTWRTNTNRWLRNHVYVYGAIRFIVRNLTGKPDSYHARGFGSAVDPYETIVRDGGEWDNDFAFAYADGGSVRNRCRAYFDSQIRFFLRELADRIPSMRRLHLVAFPDSTTLELLRRGEASANVATFTAMAREGLINGYVNLPQLLVSDGLDINDLRCTGDIHFCEAGNEWIASAILEGIAFE